MKLKQWAEANGVSYNTALRWFHAGQLPVDAHQTPTGTILVYPDAAPQAAMQEPATLKELEDRLATLYEWARNTTGRIEELEAVLKAKQ